MVKNTKFHIHNLSRWKKKTNHQTVDEENIVKLTREGKTTIEVTICSWMMKAGLWLGATQRRANWFAKICILCCFITNIGQVIQCIVVRDNLEKLFECFSVLFFCGIGFAKLTLLQFRKNEWYFLFKTIFTLENDQLNNNDTSVNYESDEENDTTKDIVTSHITRYTKQFKSTTTLIYKIYFFTAFIYVISPFVEYLIYKSQGKVNRVEFHILPVWYPFDNIFMIIFSLVVEIIASFYCVAIHIIFDSSATGTMMILCGQFALLRECSGQVSGRGRQFNLCSKRDARAHYRIKKCHFIHVSLLSMVNKLNDLIRNIIGIYFFLSTLTLCCVALQLQSMTLSTTQLISLLQYMFATLIQLLLYCHYGDAVQNESAVCTGDGPFSSSWWCLSGRVRREIAVLCTGMSRKCTLLAGPFSVLNLQAFIQIVKAAYSYYTVLRQTSQ